MRSVIFLLLLSISAYLTAEDQELKLFESDSIRVQARDSILLLDQYKQRSADDQYHTLILPLWHILSVNGFADTDHPRVSITSSENIVSRGLSVENRIYWISFKSTDEMNKFIRFIWNEKADLYRSKKHTKDF